MEAMSGNQYYQMFEDSYGRITNPPGGGGSIKADPSVIPPPTPNSIYDTASQQGYGTSSGAPSPAVAAAPGANWGGYTGSELDFPSPASMGGMATIPTTAYSAAATAANGGRYPGVTNENSGRFPNDLSAAPSPYQPHDYYSHQNYAGLNAQSASSHSPTGGNSSSWQQPGNPFEIKSESGSGSHLPDQVGTTLNDHVTTTSGFYGYGAAGMAPSPGSGPHPPAPMSTSPSLSMHSDFGGDPSGEGDNNSRGAPNKRGAKTAGRPSSTTPSSSSQSGRGGKRKKVESSVVQDPEIKAVKDKERRHSNNTRERIRIKDINEALCELGRVCRSLKMKNINTTAIGGQNVNGNDDKPQTKLGILNTAVEVITALEREVRERNLNTSALAIRQTSSASSPVVQQQPAPAMHPGGGGGQNYHLAGYPGSAATASQSTPSPAGASSNNSRPSSGGSVALNQNGVIAN